MGQHRVAVRQKASERLFADRQVYVRTAVASHYVRLSRGLQIGVVLGFFLGVGGLALGAYAAVTKHVETIAQGRELARLERVNQSLRVALESAHATENGIAEPAASVDLGAALDEARASRERALSLAAAARAEADELRRELALAEDQIEELKDTLAKSEGRLSGTLARLAALAERSTVDGATPAAHTQTAADGAACPEE